MTVETAVCFSTTRKTASLIRPSNCCSNWQTNPVRRERIDEMFGDLTVALTSLHLNSNPHDDSGQHGDCALHRRLAARREEDTVISGP
jgi:hypothetical protein